MAKFAPKSDSALTVGGTVRAELRGKWNVAWLAVFVTIVRVLTLQLSCQYAWQLLFVRSSRKS